MRPFMFLLVATIALFVATPQLHGQDSTSCGFDEHQQTELTEQGGVRITSFGTVKALFIFIDFSDDDVDVNNPTWPVGVGPNYLQDIVDVDENQNSGIHANVTTFFRDMSGGLFTMIGEAYYVQAPQPLSWYVQNHSGQESHHAAKDAIEALDEQMDFADFDRWIYNGSFNHEEGQDGKLDMVFVCFRRWYLYCGLYCGSFPAEGWYGAYLPSGVVQVDKGERQIVSAQAVDVLQMMQYPRLEHMVHEFGHVWGLPHNYSGGLWSLMGHRSPNVSSFMNSFEREQLGWIAFHDVTVNGSLVDLQDFGTTGTAYRLAIPGTSERFMIENHQVLSQYDLVDLTSGGAPGLYILQKNSSNLLRVVAADGRWNWSNPFWIHNPWSTNPLDSIPVYKRETVNRTTGYTDKVEIPHTKNGSGLMHAWLDEQTGQLATPAPRFKGDGKDRFTVDENNMFSPWSGYAAYNWSGSSATTLGVEVVSNQPNNKIRVRFYTTTPVNGPPSKPQDIRGSIYIDEYTYRHPRLTWAAMLEPDMINGGNILVHRRYKSAQVYPPTWSSWSLIATLSGDSTEYIDMSISTAGMGDDSVQYRIQAKDSTAKLSVYSDVVSLSVGTDMWKLAGNNEGKPSSFDLAQNYPNPFNPSTTIKYQLAADGVASLKVFDILGRELTTLAHGFQPAGYYSTTFNADKFASGVYFVRFTVADEMGRTIYTKMSKLLLVR